MGLFKKIKKVAKFAVPVAASAYGLSQLAGPAAAAAGGAMDMGVGGIGEAMGLGSTGSMFSGLPSFSSLSPIIGSAIGAIGQNWTNQQQIELAQQQMAFQERMSGTAYQRAVADMQAAGLNPMLAYQQGGASSPGGAMPTIGNKVAAGMAAAAQIAATENTTASNDLIRAQTQNEIARKAETESKTVQNLSSAGQLDAQRDNVRQEMTGFEIRLKNILANTTNLDWNALRNKTQAELNRYAFEYLSPAQKAKIWADVHETENKAKLLGLQSSEFQAYADFWNTQFGRSKPYVDYGLGAAGKALDFIPSTKALGGAVNSAAKLQSITTRRYAQ